VTTGGDTQSLLIPANTLIFRQNEISVGIVGSDHKVEVRKIKIGKDLGTSLEVVQRLSADDRVILNPSASLATGKPSGSDRRVTWACKSDNLIRPMGPV